MESKQTRKKAWPKSGFCIYRIDFKAEGKHLVTVNRDPEQYGGTDAAEDAENLNKLLDWWTRDSYDFQNEWLAETLDAIHKED